MFCTYPEGVFLMLFTCMSVVDGSIAIGGADELEEYMLEFHVYVV